ncbi:TonB family protein [Bradyrhizobium australiense]|uniref:Energy transducer TonB n=1 Tax=Bradyrhizobium australiense TaxID=2721161 RepID=A0A7Y4GV41_9BRAD|nr:energy transducer TonB [Bradyrhizobium australiense]NOJ42259.1 energy transducer TonB [Bradyrhizobium australiense]
MNAFVLHDASDHAVVRRWGVSAFAIVAAHAVLIALAVNWATQRPVPGVSLPVIMIDMAPVSSAPQPTQMDLAPGPVMQQADASPPPETAQQEVVQEQIAPTPPQEKPEIVAPPEQKTEPTPPKPAKVEHEKKPSPVKPKVVRADAKKPSDAPPAPRTTASPKAERQEQAASAASAGASAAALASYRQMVAAHLQRFKQYPPAAKAAGQQGTARVNFTLSRNGAVLSASLGGSSGHSALDAETLAMVRRAQPFPAFPADVKQSSMPFSAPVAFYIR